MRWISFVAVVVCYLLFDSIHRTEADDVKTKRSDVSEVKLRVDDVDVTISGINHEHEAALRVVASNDEQPLTVKLPPRAYGKITEVAACSWMGMGVAVVVETSDGSYYWVTLWLANKRANKNKYWSHRKKESGRNIGVMATGTILTNTDDLEIGEVSNPEGDTLLAILLDPKPIPDSKLRLAFTFDHRCPFADIPGRLHRSYLTENAVKRIRARRDAR